MPKRPLIGLAFRRVRWPSFALLAMVPLTQNLGGVLFTGLMILRFGSQLTASNPRPNMGRRPVEVASHADCKARKRPSENPVEPVLYCSRVRKSACSFCQYRKSLDSGAAAGAGRWKTDPHSGRRPQVLAQGAMVSPQESMLAG